MTVLWEDTAAGYVVGRPYIVTADCVGSQLRVYLDGVELVTITDEELASGGIGLYCWRNTGARFVDVRVAEPTWRTDYTFSDEERLPAGTRIRVYAGNISAAPAEEPNTHRRFVAALEERGEIRFPPTGVDLRLVDPTDNVGHKRRFLPDSAHGALANVKVLRKADGTGFFILGTVNSDIGSRLSPGQYRLIMTYRRDIQAEVLPDDPAISTSTHRDRLVLTEAGNSEDETVVLDIPWSLNG